MEWCVSNQADHGGLYSYRMCTDDDIVAKFIDPSHTPNATEMAALETCFQEGQLNCDDVPGQVLPFSNGSLSEYAVSFLVSMRHSSVVCDAPRRMCIDTSQLHMCYCP